MPIVLTVDLAAISAVAGRTVTVRRAIGVLQTDTQVLTVIQAHICQHKSKSILNQNTIIYSQKTLEDGNLWIAVMDKTEVLSSCSIPIVTLVR